MKPQPIDKPTRHTIETLFREMRTQTDAGYDAYREACNDAQELEQKLCDCPAMKKLVAKREQAHREYQRRRAWRIEALSAVRQEYLAKGLTPAVHKKILQLVEHFKTK